MKIGKVTGGALLLGALWAGGVLAGAEPGRPDRESIEAERDSTPAVARQRPDEPEDEKEKEEEEEKPTGLLGEHLHGRGGLSLEYIYTGDVFNNARGGLSTHRATSYRGNLDLVLKADLEKMGFRPGGNFFLYGENGHGFGPTRYVGDFQIADNIDAPDFMQVAEFWYDHSFWEKSLTVRLGKQDCNAEFAVVDLGGDFINSSFGLPPTIPMPTFPSSSMGVVTFFKLSEQTTFKVGVWDGMPEIGNWGFSGTGITFTVGELKTKYDLGRETKLPGDFHVGVWYHSGAWVELTADEVVGSVGQQRTARYFGLGEATMWRRPGKDGTLADGPIVAGNHGVYLGLDQLLFKESGDDTKGAKENGDKAEEAKDADDQKTPRGLGAFCQYGWAPEDRNWAHQYVGGGLVYRGLFRSRDKDLLGAGVAHVIFSDELQGSGHETAIELFYKAVLTPWVSVQPDLQYIVSPSGVERDALLVGLRFESVF